MPVHAHPKHDKVAHSYLLNNPPDALGGGVGIVPRVLGEQLHHHHLASWTAGVHVGEGAATVNSEAKLISHDG